MHNWFVKAIDSLGNWRQSTEKWIVEVDTTIGTEETQNVPAQFVLFSPTPNPSMNSIVIKYGLPEKANVSLSLYDISGRLVKNLCSGTQEKGYYTVSLSSSRQSGIPKGVYFLKFSAGNYKATKKLTILG